MLLAELLRDGIGASDCELLRDGALAQPVNAITSLAYVGVGAAVVVVAWRRRRLDLTTIVFAVCLAAIGVGSVLFHGPQPAGSRFLHDVPITVTVWFIVVHDLWLLRRRDGALAAFGVVAAAVTIASAISLEVGTALTGLGVGAIAVLEALIYRRRARAVDTARQRRAYAIVIGISATAAATYVLGRTGSPTCDPDSAVQLHGLWHLLSGPVFGTWWWLAHALPTRVERREPARLS